MCDYKSVAKSLQCCASDSEPCEHCNCELEECNPKTIMEIAADAIEELLAAVRSVVHCKDCELWTKQEASIQGRCARLAIYPTGEFYCASGSKREPPKEVQDD